MYLSNYLPQYLFAENFKSKNIDAAQSFSTTEFVKKEDGNLQNLNDNTHGKLDCQKSKTEKPQFRYSPPIKTEKKPCPCMNKK